MARNRVFLSVLLAAGVLLMAACASQPASAPGTAALAPTRTPLLEKKFQRATVHYQQFQHEGQTVYCRKEKATYSNIPEVQCLTESQLRQEVESFERWRNPVARPLMPGAGQGAVGG